MNGLRALREKRLITQKELAARSRIGVATISRLERAKVSPSLRTIRALARALNMNPEEFRDMLTSRQPRLIDDLPPGAPAHIVDPVTNIGKGA